MNGAFQPGMILALIPIIGVFITGLFVFIFDLIGSGRFRNSLAWITITGLGLTAATMLVYGRAPQPGEFVFGGMLRWDTMSMVFSLLFIFAGMMTTLLAKRQENLGNRGEFYLMMLTSIIGMCLMAGATDLVMLFLAIETTSIPLYVLAGFIRKDNLSTEAGFKYFLFGAVTSAVILFGFSLLFGFSGTTQIYGIYQGFQNTGATAYPAVLAMLFVAAGLSFKIAAAPFHFWAPDVYQGAPSVVTGFLSTASKAAGFAVIIRFFPSAFYGQIYFWSILFSVISVLSMTFGNLTGITPEEYQTAYWLTHPSLRLDIC